MPSSSRKVVWQPMPGKIVCRVVGERDTFGSGLILRPPTHEQPRTTAEVVAIYEPFLNDENEESTPFVAVGDIVIFGKHSGIIVEYGTEKVVVLRETEILTKVKLEDIEDIAAIGVAPDPFDDLEG